MRRGYPTAQRLRDSAAAHEPPFQLDDHIPLGFEVKSHNVCSPTAPKDVLAFSEFQVVAVASE
jgi:hypothetical protein